MTRRGNTGRDIQLEGIYEKRPEDTTTGRDNWKILVEDTSLEETTGRAGRDIQEETGRDDQQRQPATGRDRDNRKRRPEDTPILKRYSTSGDSGWLSFCYDRLRVRWPYVVVDDDNGNDNDNDKDGIIETSTGSVHITIPPDNRKRQRQPEEMTGRYCTGRDDQKSWKEYRRRDQKRWPKETTGRDCQKRQYWKRRPEDTGNL